MTKRITKEERMHQHKESWFKRDPIIAILILFFVIIIFSILVSKFRAFLVPYESMSEDLENNATDVLSKPSNIATQAYGVKDNLEKDAADVITEAKGLANNPKQTDYFFKKYTFNNSEDNSQIFIGTPYLIAVSQTSSAIEKYDPYSVEEIKLKLNDNLLFIKALGLATNSSLLADRRIYETYMKYGNYSWDSKDLRAIIEYDDGKLCRGDIKDNDVKIQFGTTNYSSNFLNITLIDPTILIHKTSISALFNCYSGIYNKIVDVIFVVNSDKFTFKDVDMKKFK